MLLLEFYLKCNLYLQEQSAVLKLKDEKDSVDVENDKLLEELVCFGLCALHMWYSCLSHIKSIFE